MGQTILKKINQTSGLSFVDSYGTASVLIDFSNVNSIKKNIEIALTNSTPLVIGTTGLREPDFLLLREASKKIPVFHSSNMSEGMAAFKTLVSEAAKKLGENASVEIIETHHIHKMDTPSGTAILLKEMLPLERGVKVTSIREGEVMGEHKVIFSVGSEIIELTHKAGNREIFATGALKAAKWLILQKPGYYSMDDALDAT